MPQAVTRLSVNLIQRSVDALAVIAEHTDDSKTDSINRALQMYAWWLQQEAAGYTHHMKDKDGNVSQILRMG